VLFAIAEVKRKSINTHPATIRSANSRALNQIQSTVPHISHLFARGIVDKVLLG